MPITRSGDHPQAAIHPAHPPRPAPAGARQALRPLRVVLLNGAAQKCEGDLRIARLLGNTALQVELTILRDQHAGERDITPHLLHSYRSFAEVQSRIYDALVVAGFGHHDGQPPDPGQDGGLAEVIAWSFRQGQAGLVLGAAAFAVLGRCYAVGGRRLPARLIGMVRHQLAGAGGPLLRGQDRQVWVPVVDGRGLERGDLPHGGALASLVESAEAGIHLLHDAARRFTFVLNDISAEAEAAAPWRAGAERAGAPGACGWPHGAERGWRAHAQLLFANWLATEVARSGTAIPPSHRRVGP